MHFVMAQEECIVKLNEAEKLYEEGKIERIPELLNNCIENGFDKEYKIRALRLLTLVYLFEDNTTKAEKTLLRLLKFDPEFKVNQSIDPVEFSRLFDSYNTAPVLSLGAIVSVNLSFPRLIEPISLNEFENASPTYSNQGLGFNLGIKTAYHINALLDVAFEPGISYNSFSVTENVSDFEIATMDETMILLNLPIYGAYSIYRLNNYNFFAEAGLSYGMFLSGSMSGIVNFTNNENTDIEGSSFNTNINRKKHIFMGSLGAGTKIDLNRSNLQIGIRYQFGLNNLVVNNDFYENYPSDYQYIDNNFTNNTLSLTINYNYEFYIHKKKPRNKTNLDVIK
jgi:hypothetical protein